MYKKLVILFIPILLFSSGISTHYHMVDEIQQFVENSFTQNVYQGVNNWAIDGGSMAPDYWRERWAFKEEAFYLENQIADKIDSMDDDFDFHEYGAYYIRDMFNDPELLRGICLNKPYFVEMSYYFFGMLSHYLEDLYVDMVWQSYLSESYGFGDFTDLKTLFEPTENFKKYVPFSDVELYLDCVAGCTAFGSKSDDNPSINTISYEKNYVLDKKIFEDVFMNYDQSQLRSLIELGTWIQGNIFSSFGFALFLADMGFSINTPLLSDYWTGTNLVSSVDDANFQRIAIGKVIELLGEKTEIVDNKIVFLDTLKWAEIPSIFYCDITSSFDNKLISKTPALKAIKDCWSGQNQVKRCESVKKSLITQLYDPYNLGFVIDNAEKLKEKYISLPEITVYKTLFKIGDDKILDVENDHKSSTYLSFDPEGRDKQDADISAIVEIYSPTTRIDKLVESLSKKGIYVSSDNKVKITVCIFGDKIDNKELISTKQYEIPLNDLLITSRILDGRYKIENKINMTDAKKYYSIWAELSIAMAVSGDEKCFYTVNVDDFYENQILECHYNGIYGRRHKMQIITTSYPTGIKDASGEKTYFYTGSHCLLNRGYKRDEGEWYCNYLPKMTEYRNTTEVNFDIKLDFRGVSSSFDSEEEKIIIYNSENQQVLVKNRDFASVLSSLFDLKEGTYFAFLTNTKNLSFDGSDNLIEKLGSDFLNEIMFNYISNKYIVHDYDQYCIWAFSGRVVSVNGVKHILKLQEDFKRYGEGPIVLTFEDKSAPFVSVVAPEINYVTNRFGNIADKLYVEFNTDDQNKVDSIDVSIKQYPDMTMHGIFSNYSHEEPFIASSLIERP
ncbi:MAG: hypothetical protein AB7T10_05925, partial [bacterium]